MRLEVMMPWEMLLDVGGGNMLAALAMCGRVEIFS